MMYSGDEMYGDDVTSPREDQSHFVKRKPKSQAPHTSPKSQAPHTSPGGCACVLRYEARNRNGGFISNADCERLASCSTHRLTPVLVRMGGCRFIAGAQDVNVIVDALTVSSGDYVRDYSFPVQSSEVQP